MHSTNERKNPQITLEQWREWKNNPITQHLMHEIARAVAESDATPLPDDTLFGLSKAYRKDGYRELATFIDDWSIPVTNDELTPLGDDHPNDYDEEAEFDTGVDDDGSDYFLPKDEL